MQPAIIDMHQHVPGDVDARMEANRQAGIVKAVLLGLPENREPGDNDAVLAAAHRYPDMFLPYFGGVMDAMSPDDITRARDRGFVGLKFIAPLRPYNDPAYFPLYARAEELGLPSLFHLGIVANLGGWHDVDSGLMRPIHLDHIARCFPKLTVIGAHFGNPWSDEAAMAARWNPNLFFDFSGSLLKYRSPSYLGELLWWKAQGPYASPDRRDAWEKIVFGSDVDSPAIQDVVDDYTRTMEATGLSAALQETVWYGTAARMLGLG